MKAFFVRHQAAGVLWEYPFIAPPSSAQLEPIRALMLARHGEKSPKGVPWFLLTVEVSILEPDDLPQVELPGAKPASALGAVAGLGVYSAHGEGMVLNPSDVRTVTGARPKP